MPSDMPDGNCGSVCVYSSPVDALVTEMSVMFVRSWLRSLNVRYSCFYVAVLATLQLVVQMLCESNVAVALEPCIEVDGAVAPGPPRRRI